MAFIHEIQIQSFGYPGAPGYTNLYFKLAAVDADPDAQFTAVRAFLATLAGIFPTSWTGQVAANGRVLEESTGTLALLTAPSAPNRLAQGGGMGTDYGSGVSGAVIGWATATLNRGRIVRGRTFAVPISAMAYDPDGTLTADAGAVLDEAAGELISADVGFGVWSRPVAGVGGLHGEAISHNVTDRVAFLSSRRS